MTSAEPTHEVPDAAELDPQDQKLLALARGARARIQAARGGAVRDETGRSYAGADVALPGLEVTGLQLAVAQAVAAGARSLEAAAVVCADPDDPGELAVAGALGSGAVPVLVADRTGRPLHLVTVMADTP